MTLKKEYLLGWFFPKAKNGEKCFKETLDILFCKINQE